MKWTTRNQAGILDVKIAVISAILIFIVLVWWGVERVQFHKEQTGDTRRREEILALRQKYVGLRPNDPVAQELFGDALRQASYPEEAIKAYATAERLHAGSAAGVNLASKIRLTRLDVTESAHPERLGQTLTTRESVCPRCGSLSLPECESCAHCGAALLVSGFWETAGRGGKMRGELFREIWPLLAKFTLILIAIACATFLPEEARFATLIAAIIVIPFALLKQLGDPTLSD